MTWKNLPELLLLCLASATAQAQAIDNTLSYKNVNSASYLRINYENDFFSATDQYYTWGMQAELVAPWVKDFPLSKLLVRPKYGYLRYGVGVEQDAYTPVNSDTSGVVPGERPYAASLMLKTFSIAIDTVRKQRFSTTLSTGILGPGAGGKQIQIPVHEYVPHNSIPQGWANQVQNDVILNYQADYEKQVVAVKNVFSLDVAGMARAGTLSDKAGIGFTTMFGYFQSPFSSSLVTKKNFRIYAYDHPELNVVGYDATMQGGLFDHDNAYTIKPADITRLVFQNRFGFVCAVNRIYFEYFQTYLTKEYKDGLEHHWGGIQVSFTL